MAKYDALREYLSARSDALPQLTLTFSDVEALVGPLPDSARLHPGWWGNDTRPETGAWGDAGWRVLAVDQVAERVVFARGAVGGRRTEPRFPAVADPPPAVAGLSPAGDAPPPDGVQPFPDDDLPAAAAQARAAWPDSAAPARTPAIRQYAGAKHHTEADHATEADYADPDYSDAVPVLDVVPALTDLEPPDSASAFGGGDRHSRRARRLAAHLDASLRAVTGRGFSEHGGASVVRQPSSRGPESPASGDQAETGPRIPHGATQPGRQDAGPLDPGIAPALVESMLEDHLLGEGWTVRHAPDGRSGDFGASMTATRHNRTLAITVRGYPAFVPARGEGAEAPAAPPVRARQWYAQALLEAVLVRGAQPDVDIALGLPDVPVYRALYARSRDTFGRLNLLIFFAGADGRVRDH